AHGVGRHVQQDQIGGAVERRFERLRRFVGHEVHLQDRHAFERLGFEQVDADHAGRGRTLAHHLAPSPRRDAEIDDAFGALEQAEPVVEFDQLVRGAAPVAFGFGLLDVRVVELPLEPASGRGGATARGSDPPVRILARAAHEPTCFNPRKAAWAASPSASAAISPRRIPSRIPRSATPSRSAGQMSRMPSRMAQPATTRPARSWPMHGNWRRSCGDIEESRVAMSRIETDGTIRPSTALRSYCGRSRCKLARVVTVPLVPSRLSPGSWSGAMRSANSAKLSATMRRISA